MAGITPAEPPVGAVMTRWPRAFSSEAARANAETSAMARSLSYLSSWARSKTVAAFECSLIGPGSTPSLTARPAFTVASMAPAILSRNALICSSVLPDTATSLAMITWAIESLFFSACFAQFLHRGVGILGLRPSWAACSPSTRRTRRRASNTPVRSTALSPAMSLQVMVFGCGNSPLGAS